jgi:hypothetical protein
MASAQKKLPLAASAVLVNLGLAIPALAQKDPGRETRLAGAVAQGRAAIPVDFGRYETLRLAYLNALRLHDRRRMSTHDEA